MKKIVLLFLVVVSLCSFTSSENLKPFKIVGKWENTGKGEKNSGFIFDADGYAYVYKNTEKIGGKNFSAGGVKGVMKYVFDKKSNPNKLDLVITVTVVKPESKKVLMLVKVIDDNTINIAAGNDENVRPTSFTKENTVIFKRVN